MRFMRIIFILAVATCLHAADPLPTAKTEIAFPNINFDHPLCMVWPPDTTSRVMVVEQAGTIRVVSDPMAREAPLFLDIRDRVSSKGREEGLLCLAFHPQYDKNGQLFVWYTAGNPRRDILSRFTCDSANPNKADPTSEVVLLSVDDPYANHNGGATVFGPDGFLYQSLGDGGAGGDPLGSGQNLESLLGKILRIDVDHADPGLPYAIPKDNPFVGKAGARGEIWAYGLRNVWRMSFDSATGDLWAGDVGQNAYEEIDLITKGGNYGWNIREGAHPFKGGGNINAIEPIVEYPRTLGISVTGGYVYRGKANPALVGWYVYGDFQTGRIWALKRQANGETRNIELQGQGKLNISSFAENRAGELFITAFDKKIYRLVP